jgi:anti-sigma factor RsiW
MTCPSREDLVAVHDAALPGPALAEARRHVEACAACRAELERLAAGIAALRAGSPSPEPSPWFEARLAARLAALPPPRDGLAGLLRARPWRLAAAAGLAAALAAGLLLVQRERAADGRERAGAAAIVLALADRLELLEDYEVVASLGDVETEEDAAVVAALDRLPPREGRP